MATPAPRRGLTYTAAIKIQPAERDRALKLTDLQWPLSVKAPTTWKRGAGWFERHIYEDPAVQIAAKMTESIMRFPSAPIHSIQRLHEYHSDLPESLHLHTYRVLTHSPAPRRISRIFLFHNGLNELDRLGLFYKLSSQLIADDGGVACILRPFPSHLTRAPFALQYAETPLQRYLWDGSQLFQQFIRYMVETQWFLSALVKRSRYPCLVGADLLAQEDEPSGSRLDPDVLAGAIARDFRAMNKASEKAFDKVVEKQHEAREIGKAPAGKQLVAIVRDSIVRLRERLKLANYDDLGSNFEKGDKEPSVHVIGYSLGGFAAQSAFMSWPSVISSSSTLLSGGALRELAPTAFANPEEWQTVLHSLRYELDDWMLDRLYDDEAKKRSATDVVGLKREVFHHFQRTFYEVFQQEYHGSFGTRLAAFRKRMLFVVGGDDSIVRPQTVLASSPPGGINLLEVGGVGHFLGSRAVGEEKAQQDFWLPEMGGLIGRFSKQAADQQAAERLALWGVPASADPDQTHASEAKQRDAGSDAEEAGVDGQDAGGDPNGAVGEPQRSGVERGAMRLLRDKDILELPPDGALPNELFERCLDDTLVRLDDSRSQSRLIISRNELPEVLLEDSALQARARAVNHDEASAVAYCENAMRRHAVVANNTGAVRILLPWNARRIVEHLDSSHGFPSQSETAGGHRPPEYTPAKIWREFTRSCREGLKEVVSIFDGRPEVRPDRRLGDVANEYINDRLRSPTLAVPSLPDCWIWISPKFLRQSTLPESKAVFDRQFIERVKSLYHDGSDEQESILEELSSALREATLRVITISRARYNPRFRGKLVFEAEAVRDTLTHVALCLAVSWSYDKWIESGVDGSREWSR